MGEANARGPLKRKTSTSKKKKKNKLTVIKKVVGLGGLTNKKKQKSKLENNPKFDALAQDFDFTKPVEDELFKLQPYELKTADDMLREQKKKDKKQKAKKKEKKEKNKKDSKKKKESKKKRKRNKKEAKNEENVEVEEEAEPQNPSGELDLFGSIVSSAPTVTNTTSSPVSENNP